MIKKIRYIVSINLIIPLLAMANVMTITPGDLPQSYKDQEKAREAEQKRNGFYKTESKFAKFLLNRPDSAPAEIEKYQFDTNPGDSHLKASMSQIKLAVPRPNLDAIKNNKIIGYAAAGGWKNGWTGMVVFFQANNSVCDYSFQNIVSVTNDEKMFPVDIEGNSTGMLYSITWFDKRVMRTLECANKIYDKELAKSFAALARELDRDSI
jgi:hypothetical protein